MRKFAKQLCMVTVSAVMAVSGTGTALAATDFVNSGPGVGLGDLESGGVIDTTTPESDGSQSGSVQNNDGQAGNEENGDGQTAEETGETVPEAGADVTTSVDENGITYQTVNFGQLHARYRMGKGTQITNITLTLQNQPGNIAYGAYVNNGGWQPWTFNDQPTGGMEDSTYVEGFRIMPRNGLEKVYDVYYSCTMSGMGKLGYAKNGEMAGAPGRGEYVTGVDIVFVPKGQPGPVSEKLPFYTIYHDQITTNENGLLVYSDPNYTGWLDQEGYRWYVSAGQVLTGWQYIDGYQYYFGTDGILVQDVEHLLEGKQNYLLRINKAQNCLTVYAQDGANGHIIPVKAMVTSVGDDTPLGTFQTPVKYEWRQMVTGAYAQYATRVKAGAGYLMHSVIFDVPNNHTLWTDTYNGLGVLRSLGCIRLTTGNAKWIYDHCPVGTTIEIYESDVPSPFTKPGVIPLPEGQNYDPTDPTA
ncbi:MAG: L,D-transpeptidase family protein [Hungatella sp.]